MIQALSRLADERVVKPFEFALRHIHPAWWRAAVIYCNFSLARSTESADSLITWLMQAAYPASPEVPQ